MPSVVLQLVFPQDISQDVVLLSNTSGFITNSNLELAAEVLALGEGKGTGHQTSVHWHIVQQFPNCQLD